MSLANPKNSRPKVESLEDSIDSLLSKSNNDLSSSDTTQYHSSVVQTQFEKAASLFIRKRFDNSFDIVEPLAESTVSLYSDGLIEESLFVNVWSLYLNLIDIFVNKSIASGLLKERRAHLKELVSSGQLLDQLYEAKNFPHPKLVNSILWINLNSNDQSNLKQTKGKLDFYLEYANHYIPYSEALQKSNNSKYSNFLELLETYHIQLLSKLNLYDESANSIRETPHFKNPDELVAKLNKIKADREIEIKRKKELLKNEKPQKGRENKHKNGKRRTHSFDSVKESSGSGKEVIKASDKSSETQVEELSLLNILKRRLIVLTKGNASLIIVLILGVLGFLPFTKYRLITLNRDLRQKITNLRTRVLQTIAMAFKVSYV